MKKHLMIPIGIVAALAIALVGTMGFAPKQQTATSYRVVNGPVSAVYLDHMESMGQLAKNSDAIVRVTVESQKQYNDMVVANTVRVKKAIKGEVAQTIIVTQMGSLDMRVAKILDVGQTYVLFLNRHDQPDTFYIVGAGEQGIFKEFKGKLVGRDQSFADEVKLNKGEKPLDALERHIKGTK